MSIHNHILIAFLAITTTTITVVSATISAPAKEFLDAHNKARAVLGISPLIWSQTLEIAASRLARYQKNNKSCEFANLNPGKYGANQLLAKGLTTVTPRLAVETWVNEKPFYNYKSDTCAPNHTCGVYKQVVWRNSKELGCAQATCVKESTVLTICFYNPPGNIIGQKPY